MVLTLKLFLRDILIRRLDVFQRKGNLINEFI
jgi:hypothetical protein